jgi:hypothetical protein
LSNKKRDVLVDVAQFVALTVALSSVFAMFIIRAGHITSGRSWFTRGLMWSPGGAALAPTGPTTPLGLSPMA